MKWTTWLIASLLLVNSVALPIAELNAYGYQPDSGGYAYTDSTYAVDSSPLMPVAAVSVAVIIGVILYSGHHHHHHKHDSCHCH